MFYRDGVFWAAPIFGGQLVIVLLAGYSLPLQFHLIREIEERPRYIVLKRRFAHGRVTKEDYEYLENLKSDGRDNPKSNKLTK